MTAAEVVTTYITCDHPEHDPSKKGGNFSSDDVEMLAREQAQEKGWVKMGTEDWCPQCASIEKGK